MPSIEFTRQKYLKKYECDGCAYRTPSKNNLDNHVVKVQRQFLNFLDKPQADDQEKEGLNSMSSTECPTDALTESNVDSEDKTTVENAEKQESEENAEKQESEIERNARICAHAERILGCWK